MQLHPITPDLARSEAVATSEVLRPVCEAILAMHGGTPPAAPWGGYLVQEEGAYIGTCAFKSAPEQGAVEIAYFTFPGHEGQGVATRMAQALLQLARDHGAKVVRAQTLPEENASTSILRGIL